MLGALGLEPVDEAVYRCLVGQPSAATAEELEPLEFSPPLVAEALTRLRELGLVNCDRAGRYSAVPPAVGLGALITERRDALRVAEHTLITLAEEHRSAVAGRTVGELIEIVTGADAIRHRFQQVQHAARTQLRTFVTMPFVAVPPGANTAESAAVDRGVRFQAVLEREVMEVPHFIDETVESLSRGVEVRVAEKLPIKLLIADADLALVPLTIAPGGEPAAVLLHRSGLVAALEALFETVWERAHPLEIPPVGTDRIVELEPVGITELDLKILALLLAGLSDQAVSAQLDLSLRTLQRRMRHLMDIAGVGTRMQLGWYAAEKGWIKPT